ncbi:MAG: phosphate ABC transporter substrate-binding protein [Kiritimatiellaeota bacterium]|nr:phosphate ABC transporter substrate-binding protein [Kiritimatiellota bacterium]
MKKLLPLLLAAAPMFAGTLTIDGSTTVGPLVKALSEDYRKTHDTTEITLSESGSGNGAKSLVNGLCDIAMLSRPLKDTEFKAAVEKGVLPTAHVLAYDAIVLIAHPSNPVKNLTLEQARDIFSGKVTNWKELGGADMAIVAVSRDTNSGTYETFEGMVMKGEKVTANAETVGSNGAVRQRVQATAGAVGYVGIGYVDRSTKALTIANVEATYETVTTGRYALSRPLFLYTDGYPALGTELHTFVNMYLTKRGQAIIEAVGFVPVTQY